MKSTTQILFLFAIAAVIAVFLAFFVTLSNESDHHEAPQSSFETKSKANADRSQVLSRPRKSHFQSNLAKTLDKKPRFEAPNVSTGHQDRVKAHKSPITITQSSDSRRPAQDVESHSNAVFLDHLDNLDNLDDVNDDDLLVEDDSQTLNSGSSHVATSSARCLNETFTVKCHLYKYVQFWRNRFTRPQDCFSSPLRQFHPDIKNHPEKYKYLLFMPDEGGWNNIRMAAETAIVFAIVTGRVLVLPPDENFYLLNKNRHGDNKSNFDKFFDLSRISPEIVDIITMDEFLTHVAGRGLLKNPLPNQISLSPGDIEGFARSGERLWTYIESSAHTRIWRPGKYFISFNFTDASTGEGVNPKTWLPSHLLSPPSSLDQDLSSRLVLGEVDPSNNERVARFASHGRSYYPYHRKFHDEIAVYFPGDYRETHRLLTHFYTYLFFDDPRLERYYKRMVRDRLHYHEDIFCYAGQVVKMLHELSTQLSGYDMPVEPAYPNHKIHNKQLGGNTNINATYFAYHIRRGDFQYDHTKLPAEKIWSNTKHLLDSNRTNLIYIATDEQNKSFFEPFKNNGEFQLVFFDDFISKIQPIHIYDHEKKPFNKNHIGMIEQVICANAHTFIGTPLSTFTGYITRMRGYYRDNRYARTFYTMQDVMYQLREKPEIVGPFWAREFAVAHRAVDDDPQH